LRQYVSCKAAPKGRTHDRKRPALFTKKLLQAGGYPHMKRPRPGLPIKAANAQGTPPQTGNRLIPPSAQPAGVYWGSEGTGCAGTPTQPFLLCADSQ